MKRYEYEALCHYFVSILTHDTLSGRSPGCVFAHEVAKG